MLEKFGFVRGAKSGEAFVTFVFRTRSGVADETLSSRPQHVVGLNQLSLVVLHVLDERASGVIDAVYLVVLGGEGLSEDGGEGDGGDVLGGESEDVSDLFASIELGRLGKLEHCVALADFIGKGKWVPMDHSKSKKHTRDSVYI